MLHEHRKFFRAGYTRLDTTVRMSNALRADVKFETDKDNKYVFTMLPLEFESLSEESIIGDEWEALDVGTVIVGKPIYEGNSEYREMIKNRVKVGSVAYFVAGSLKIAKLEIKEILNFM